MLRALPFLGFFLVLAIGCAPDRSPAGGSNPAPLPQPQPIPPPPPSGNAYTDGGVVPSTQQIDSGYWFEDDDEADGFTGRLPDGGVDCSQDVDYDFDGYTDHRCGGNDCNDENAYINPSAAETCDNLDNDCDGELNNGIECWFYAHSSTSLYRIDPFKLTHEFVISVPSLYDMDTSPAPESVLYGLTGSGWLKSFDEDEETWNNLDNAQSSIGGNGFAIDNYRRAFVTKSNKLYEVDLNTGGIIEEWELDTPDLWIQSSGDCVVNKNNSFYMTSSAPATNDLIYVDPSTMKGVLVGNTGFSGIWGLTAAFGKLYGLTSAGQLLLIDPSTAETVELHDFPISFYGAASSPSR